MQNTSLADQISAIQNEALAAFKAAKNSQELYDLKVKFLGKNGSFNAIMKEFGKAPASEKPKLGQLVNQAKTALESAYMTCETQLKSQEMSASIARESLDLTLPGTERTQGSLHPITLVIEEMVQILSRIGFSVRTGPLIESDRNNFEALNIPADHPSRDMQDTFYINPAYVLRTHTSPVQARTMESEKPPIRILAPGPVFRSDSDISHSPNFNQIEGLLVDEKVSMADLKGTISFFVKELFGTDTKVRFRPSFFPFTEPSAEVDCTCPICKGKGCRMCKSSGWIEIGGCGLIHPKVLSFCGIDAEKWQGYAFGFGIERIAIIKYGIDDIRLFSENDTRFLKQF
ncbi:MAG: phenylalanine--tRNA ligase subunit alpha [Bdellovibrionota bacterium]